MKKDENAFSKKQQEFTAMAVRSLPYLNSGMMQHFIQNPDKMGGLFQQLPFVFWAFFAWIYSLEGSNLINKLKQEFDIEVKN